MRIHTQIRSEVVELLEQQISDVEHYYNGRPTFIDIDEEQKAIAVFLDEAYCHSITNCDEQWQAQLNIAIYIKSIDNGEGELDEIAQQIAEVMQTTQSGTGFEHIDNLELSQYSYEQDQQQRTWYVANLIFNIEYQREGV
ncbi:phage tail terminator protein [Glaesserella parasuis]|uniref:phage tail terminator protein n=1 Tax=Glaesserella parasuis TaxID=738 RepID=UPI00243700AE|nr:phage tail terminator protein [Glaesserella parasuis]MDG6474309.1 phage tail terminator protein [Glaesserella parasuis]MDO9799806.1 phage tail terminator protein [Glaesserella parasuis]MDO9851810.1 phage tail terminator protein [Glaesserella parasuis]MDO9865205.1 phage tail terminator protein [Glaesserella parasuis]MDO9883039.1 phage tail terminator protein [Glaesserella parasuis]